MADLVVPPGYAQSLIRFGLTGDPDQMAITLGLDVSDYGGDAQLVADDLRDAWANVFTAGTGYTGWRFAGTTVHFGSDTGEGNTGENNDGYNYTATGGTPTQNVAVLVNKQTGLGGRRNKGRMYVPCFGLEEGGVSNSGVIGSTSLSAIQDLWDDFYAQVASGATHPLGPVLFHSTGSTTPTPITGFLVQEMVATQRTRLRR